MAGCGSSTRLTGRCRVRACVCEDADDVGPVKPIRGNACVGGWAGADRHACYMPAIPTNRGARGGPPARGFAVPRRPPARRPCRLPIAGRLGGGGESHEAVGFCLFPLLRRLTIPYPPTHTHSSISKRGRSRRQRVKTQRRPRRRSSSSSSGTPPTGPAARTRWRRSICSPTASCTTAPPASPRRRACPWSTSLAAGPSRTRRWPPRALQGRVCHKDEFGVAGQRLPSGGWINIPIPSSQNPTTHTHTHSALREGGNGNGEAAAPVRWALLFYDLGYTHAIPELGRLLQGHMEDIEVVVARLPPRPSVAASPSDGEGSCGGGGGQGEGCCGSTVPAVVAQQEQEPLQEEAEAAGGEQERGPRTVIAGGLEVVLPEDDEGDQEGRRTVVVYIGAWAKCGISHLPPLASI